ncbi:biliverdin-producing heme oxygenase [Luteimonas sp. BDR2-5]|uniref:biliverdin-producing heme oxygenase n=1 Tax=Proluteimonas luteida TaxID=2878685 RepID=UPI001E399734|nr:biliverdin-producing heme oxygenase [Luteimonas sp. BDR2-5]MCD9027792.1 biliverdin-producing heme oxygenase [Luteimonas sp. BDR2-5]
MTTPGFPQRLAQAPDVRHRLREATAQAHARIDARFARGLGEAGAYPRYLVGMHRFAIDFETATGRPPRQSAWLARDLVALALSPLPATQARAAIDDAGERTGWDYVMAGSSLGARRLLRDVRALGHTRESGACFLAQHAHSDDWPTVQQRLAGFDSGDARQLAALTRGALDAFAAVAACFARSFAADARSGQAAVAVHA